MWPATPILEEDPLVLTEHERSELRKSRIRGAFMSIFVWMPLLFGPGYFWRAMVTSGAWPSRIPHLQMFVQLGVVVLLFVWTRSEKSRAKSTHRRAFDESLKSGLRVCTNCEYPLPAEPLEGVCSECGCLYNPETLRLVWTERYVKLADVEPYI